MAPKRKDKSKPTKGEPDAVPKAPKAPKKAKAPKAPVAPKAAAPRVAAAAPKKAVAKTQKVTQPKETKPVVIDKDGVPVIVMPPILVPFEPKARVEPRTEVQKKATAVKVGDKTVRMREGTDLVGFRVGKTRLVAKKTRKKTVLKKLILEGLAKSHNESKLVEFVAVRATTTNEDFRSTLTNSEQADVSTADECSNANNTSKTHIPVSEACYDKVERTREEDIPNDEAGDDADERHAAADFYVPSWVKAVPSVSDEDIQILAADAYRQELPVFKQPTSDVWLFQSGCDLQVRHYVHTYLDPSIDEKVRNMLTELTRFQLRLRAENAIKFKKMKRYCIGFQEIRRALNRNKLKGLIVAPNLQASDVAGSLDDVVTGTVAECRQKDVPVIFALSRNRLGKALGRESTRLNVIGLLSVDGQNMEWKQICREAVELRNRWLLDHEGNGDVIAK